ncbi:alpha/beta hydrolase [Pseudooceanicola spongiae]|uniref:Phospholipase n=1 Tax=Pseudooceanicola spongiae TaxID=2613965 RepID=A0A7L9WH17_9RHOB|nr:dienelactone hydrolase family protein [Pseudooceanicola spongiae]QOL79645.1 phospholipase [Pseudooceanicola spongiae]
MSPALRWGGAPVARARAGLVVLHGRGGSAGDMLSLAEGLGLPDVAVAAPEAAGRSWWPTSFLAPMNELASWLDGALSAVDAAIDSLQAEGLARSAISLCGFSQGACLALEYAARSGAGLSAVFGFSGALVGTGDAPGAAQEALYGHSPKRFDYAPRIEELVIDMSCHERDPHIPLSRFEESAVILRRLGACVTRRVYPGAGHGILDADITALRAHLNQPA